MNTFLFDSYRAVEEEKKMRTKLFVPPIVLILIGTFHAAVFTQQKKTGSRVTSVYSDLSKNCRKVQENRLDVVSRCRGIAGYDLLVGFYDERFDVTVINPAKRKFDQNYYKVITSSFSDPGGKAEWRVRQIGGKMVPVALIVRVMAQENADTSPKETSYMAVSKITSRMICVTDKIGPGPRQNERAREAADRSSNKPCMK
jgi:hypothetical protein